MLRTQGFDTWLCLERDPLKQAEIRTPFDAAFGVPMNVCLRAADAVHVGFGGNEKHDFWKGYLRAGVSKDPKAFDSLVLQEAQKQLKNDIKTDDSNWYAWAYRVGVYDDNVGENIAAAVTRELVAMRTTLLDRIAAANTKR